MSELQLIDSIGRLKSAGVTDLVIDMRYNGGGLVDVAAGDASSGRASK